MTCDILAAMITSLNNASLQKAKIVEVRATTVTRSIAKVLLQENWIKTLRERQNQHHQILIIGLKYRGRHFQPCITSIEQISKPSRRIYVQSHKIPKILGGIGAVILSTSQGMMTDQQARQHKIGGEVICSVS